MSPALVIEGGANRSAYATGALCTLQQQGFAPDAAYGTSAGGALAAWYAAGQMERCADVWRYAADRRIMSYRRALQGKPILDLHALYRVIYLEEFGLDVERVKRAPYPVVVTLTDADTGETVHQDIRRVEHPTHWVHAGAALPIAAETPIELGGRRWLDGGTTDPIPIRKALDDEHREVVVVLNRMRGERKPEPAWVTRLFARQFPNLVEHARQHHAYHNDAVRLCDNPPPGVRITVIRPAVDTGLTRTTRDRKLLERAIEQGRRDATYAMAARRLR